ncbi:hypothetical protein LMG26411_06941 [Cupriavidus numazuensis]|uniref:Uncharacterized protein n=1 Tax=Cupriavidus numazuensis TaxID=221992 RepID=A0ABN7Q903_9BURK|nr:hypothetical protein LMG26411_06941 [Cupriavidus numazuensis]
MGTKPQWVNEKQMAGTPAGVDAQKRGKSDECYRA